MRRDRFGAGTWGESGKLIDLLAAGVRTKLDPPAAGVRTTLDPPPEVGASPEFWDIRTIIELADEDWLVRTILGPSEGWTLLGIGTAELLSEG